jgi:outer membrane protein
VTVVMASRRLVQLLGSLAIAATLVGTQPVRAQQLQDPKAAAAGAAAASPQAKEQMPAAVAAVIDYQRVLREAKAAKSIRDQIEGRRKTYQDQVSKEEQKLLDTDKELAKQRAVLSSDAFNTKRDDLQKKAADVQRMVQERRRSLDQTSAAALNEVRNAIIQIVSELSAERGFNLVLPTSAVLLFSPKVDLTDDVIKRLDDKLPSVKVPEKVAQDQGAQ